MSYPIVLKRKFNVDFNIGHIGK